MLLKSSDDYEAIPYSIVVCCMSSTVKLLRYLSRNFIDSLQYLGLVQNLFQIFSYIHSSSSAKQKYSASAFLFTSNLIYNEINEFKNYKMCG